LGVGLTTPPRLKILLRNLRKLNNFLRRPRPTRGCRANDDDDDDDDDYDKLMKGIIWGIWSD
jgi:hypothetical protein